MIASGETTLAAQARRWLPAALLAGVALVLGLGVIGAVLGPPLPGPTAASRPPGPASMLPSEPYDRVVVDPLTNRLAVEPWLEGQLPTAPFVYERPTSITGMMDQAVIGAVKSDPSWQKERNWPVTLVVGDLEPEAVVDGNLAGTAEGLVDELSHRLYKGLTELKVADVRAEPPTTIGSYPAQWARAAVTGRRPDGVETSAVGVLLVSLPNGRTFIWAEVRPSTARAADLSALDAALASLRATR